jgi:C-terminal processing protease CtpA/Prc
MLGSEIHDGNALPPEWTGNPKGTVFADDTTFHVGRWSVLLDREQGSEGSFSAVTRSMPVQLSGTHLTLRGYLRLAGVAGSAGLWLKEEANGKVVAFANMQDQALEGNRDWKEYQIDLPIHPEATRIAFGGLLSGTGKLWITELSLMVDGKPFAAEPYHNSTTDHEFDSGSRVHLDTVSNLQIDNLSRLARVWGFLKYHHPNVTAGKHQWDYELFRIMPQILRATSSAQANLVLSNWVENLGSTNLPAKSAKLEQQDLAVEPDIKWIYDQSYLGTSLSKELREIYDNRVAGQQFYVSLTPNVQNADFHEEPAYRDIRFPDSGFQLLALFRFWNIVQYWYPYRDVSREDWPRVLAEFIPKVALADNTKDYQLALIQLVARVHDTHANLWSSINLRPPIGDCKVPINIRFIGKQAVVISTEDVSPSFPINAGDIVKQIGSVEISQTLVQKLEPFYGDSNEASLLRDIAGSLTKGSCGPLSILLERNGRRNIVVTDRIGSSPKSIQRWHDLPGPTFRLLASDVAYLKLSSIHVSEIDHYIDQAKGTKGIILDLRNYPSEFVVHPLASCFIRSDTAFARFSVPDLSNPGAFRFTEPAVIKPGSKYYPGKVIILTDEMTQSQAEYTVMALRATPNSIVIGSQTAGADGNVSEVVLPGALRASISGIGVFYPDFKATQRVGIQPDITVTASETGIREGRDEALEFAIKYIRGKNTVATTKLGSSTAR